jgi:ribonuclease P/MRP protein subunit RPP1
MSTPRTSLRQFSRLTINIEELSDAQGLSSNDSLKRFDILAVSTTNLKVFVYLCKTADIDIISLDFTQRIHFSMNKKLVSRLLLLPPHPSP